MHSRNYTRIEPFFLRFVFVLAFKTWLNINVPDPYLHPFYCQNVAFWSLSQEMGFM